MRALLLLAVLAPAARAADVPFYLRTIESERDVSAVNENFRSVVNDLTKMRADLDALSGAPVAASGVSLASTNTWTASQVFGASVTVGPVAYTSTATTGAGATVAAGQIANSWMIVASTNPSGATASYFYGLKPNTEYRVRWPGLLQNTSLGALAVTFNGSSGGTAYSYHVDCSASNGTTDNISSAGGASFVLEGAGAAATRHHKGILEFSSNGTNTMAQTWNTEDVTTSEIMESCTGGAVYASATALSSVKLATSAGTFTGNIYLEQLISPLP